MPSLSTHELPLYGDSSISLDSLGEICQLNHWKAEFEKATIVSSDHSTEWKTYHQLLKPKDDISMQLKELLINDMLIALFPNLHKLATICIYSYFYSISRTKFLRHEINK